jgi:hypothetical protein
MRGASEASAGGVVSYCAVVAVAEEGARLVRKYGVCAQLLSLETPFLARRVAPLSASPWPRAQQAHVLAVGKGGVERDTMEREVFLRWTRGAKRGA